MILAGDVGGTKVHLALYNFDAGSLQPVRDQKFPAHEFASLDAVVIAFSVRPAATRPYAADHGGLLRLSGAGARWAAEADEPAVDAGCARPAEVARHRAYLPDQRS